MTGPDPSADSIALLFPGQGAQRPGMGLPWLDSPHWSVVDRLGAATGQDVGQLLTVADAETLRRTDNAQLATFALEMVVLEAATAALSQLPVVCCAGHSLGEYAALVAAGVLELEQAGRVVAARGRAMAEAARLTPGTMAVVLKCDRTVVESLTEELRAAGEQIWVANLNGPGQTVVSGSPAGVDALSDRAAGVGARIMRIPVGGAFHSPLMEPARTALAAALDLAAPGTARVPVIANVDAAPHLGGSAEEWRERALAQLALPVRWEQSIQQVTELPSAPYLLVELGPGSVLTGLTRRIAPDQPAVSVATPDQLADLARRLAERRARRLVEHRAEALV